MLIASVIPLGDSFLTSSNGHIIELNTNAYYFWNTLFRFDSLNYKTIYIYALTIVSAICWHHYFKSTYLFSIAFIFLCAVNGLTITSLSLIAAVGLLVTSSNFILNNKNNLFLIFALLLSLASALISQQLIFWAVLITTSILLVRSYTFSKWNLLLFSVAILFGVSLSNLPDSLNLPITAVFVPGYNYIYGVDPLIGSRPERVFINKLWVADRASILAITCFLVLCFTDRKSKVFIPTLYFAILLLLQSSLVADWVSVIAPISALSRNIPNAMLFPVAILLGALFPLLSIDTPSSTKISKPSLLILSSALYLIILAPLDTIFGNVLSPNIIDSKLKLTPSLYLTKHNLPTPPEEDYQVIPLTEKNSNIKASTNQDKVEQIYLQKDQTRWSTKPDSQSGNEWLEVHLSTPVKNLKGIEISNPTFIGDYPRGIEVYVGENKNGSCQSLTLAYKEPWWRGSVENLPSGIRYLTTQNIVKLYFTQTWYQLTSDKEINCILVKQTGQDAFYEWSVQGFNLLIMR